MSHSALPNVCEAGIPWSRRGFVGACTAALLAVRPLGATGVPLNATPALPAAQLVTLGTVAELLLPRTSTPGATDTGVTAWIGGPAWQRWLSTEQRELLVGGLMALDEASRATHGVDLAALPSHRGLQALSALDAWATHPRPPKTASVEEGELRVFWLLLKRLVVSAHYTSEAGCRAELDHRVFPGPFVGMLERTADTRSFYQDWIGVPFFPERLPTLVKAGS